MSAWDELVTLVEAGARGGTLGAPAADLIHLVQRAIDERSVDPELDADSVARWLPGLVAGYREIQDVSDRGDDAAIAELLRILTRWLHPARPRGIATL
ncbi:hypothetical protein D9V41_07085 [Aeromicrobium phragmitis]|uniref:Uncharacterized protein n=1 Tax=Aeromicrobium phragmitis TaxID=2478914 RepID=A0A3L8PLJ0_9ACTN|nr:hypothetical protein [Aeromicrobium phragmitis]RLV56195.1 hypothetical protein D9V41_07085 [Aeromicrobium phragmitis]